MKMFVILDSSNSQWADKDHTCIYARVRTTAGWELMACHQYADGLAKEIWDARSDFEFLPAPDEETDEAIVKRVQDSIQSLLDKKAHEKLYDSALYCISYMTSTDPLFKAEADAINAWRDRCWGITRKIYEEYKAGTRPRPTYAEVMSLIPPFEWDH